ncbi:MAG: hypothetical protein LC723_03285, partial [Actinobacteria bacterium]|nr:hypothetical protein [Actinomycetota bacterium]
MAIVFVVGFAIALISSRTLAGTVPGKDPILSLGVTENGYLAGTSRGAFVSKDGTTWKRSKEFKRVRTLAASVSGTVFTSSEGVTEATNNLEDFAPAVGAVLSSVAISTDRLGNLYLAGDDHTIALATVDRGLQTVEVPDPPDGPDRIIALAAVPGAKVTLFAGGISTGMWRST